MIPMCNLNFTHLLAGAERRHLQTRSLYKFWFSVTMKTSLLLNSSEGKEKDLNGPATLGMKENTRRTFRCFLALFETEFLCI